MLFWIQKETSTRRMNNSPFTYQPLQPTAIAANEFVSYEEYQPSVAQKELVYCYWELKTLKQLTADYIYRVVSDGCIDIFIEQKFVKKPYIMGFCRKYVEFPIGTEFHYIGIRFIPGAFTQLFQIDAQKLSNQSQLLENFLPELASWLKLHLTNSNKVENKIAILNEKLRFYALQQQPLDIRFKRALAIIYEQKGYLKTAIAPQVGISDRQLRRLFHFYLGTSIKSFANVVRFQAILRSNPDQKTMKDNKIYYDLGFFDQTHFIKSFQTHYGVTPTKAFK